MLKNKRLLLGIALAVIFLPAPAYASIFDWIRSNTNLGGDGTITKLDQWKSDGTNITQNVSGKPLRLTGFESLNCLGTDASGIIGSGTCSGGGSGGGLGTTTPWTAGQLSYVVNNGTVTSVATGTLSATNGITVTSNRSVVGGSATIDCTVASGSAAGCLSSTDWLSFFNKIGTTTNLTAGQVLYASGVNTASSVATGTVSSSGGITTTASRYVLGGNLSIACDVASASIPGCLSTTDWSAFNNKLGSYDAWTHPAAGKSATTSEVWTAGFLSTASSTFSSTLHLNSLSNGGLAVIGGLVSSGATTTAGTGLTYSGNAFNVNTSQNITTLSNLTTNGLVTTSGGNGTLGVTANGTNGQVLAMSGGVPTWVATTTYGSGYATTTTNYLTHSTSTTAFNGLTFGQTIIPTAGALTFKPTITGTLDNTGLSNSTISGIALGANLADLTATNATLTFSGAYNGGTARTIGLNLGNANTWTALQTFTNSSTTLGSFNYASTTFLFGANLTTCDSITGKLTWASGQFGCGTDFNTGGSGSAGTSTVDWVVYKKGTGDAVYNTLTGAETTYTSADQALNFIVNAATSTANPARTRISFRPGYYYINSPVIIKGGTIDDGPRFVIDGAGGTSTSLVAQTDNAIQFWDGAKVDLNELGFAVAGNSNDILFASTTVGSSFFNSVRESNFDNLYFYSTTTGHTGWAMDFYEDFRNTYSNIHFNQMGNGWRTTNNFSNATFINGDSHWTGFNFCEVNNSGAGNCWEVRGTVGLVNQIVFDDINGISNDSGVGSNDILLKITNGSRIVAKGLNAEQFATTTQVVSGNGIYVESSKYITATDSAANKAIFEASATAFNVSFACKEVEVSAATTILYDKNTTKGQHNTLSGIDGANCVIQDNGGSMRWATSTASVVRDIYDNVNGDTWLSAIKVLGDKIMFNFAAGANDWITSVGGAMRFVLGGTERLTISSAGSVGIGSTTPAATLGVQTVAGVDPFAVGSTTGQYLRISKIGELILGTTTAGCLNTSATGLVFAATCAAGGNNPGGSGTELQYRSGASTFGAVTTSGYTLATNNLGLGTTTPRWLLQLASSTGSQLTLSDTTLTSNHWSMRSIGGLFYVATSSPSTFATSSTAALTINANGYLGVASTSPTKTLSVQGESLFSATTTTTGLNVIAPTTATSTMYLYSKTAGAGGAIIVEDEGGSACTLITTKAGVVKAAVVTCPTEQ